MLFWSIFFSMYSKKVNNRQKLLKWHFCLTANSFFQCVFKNTDQKDICASIVFKAEPKPKHKEIFFGGFFYQKPKTRFFGGPKWQFLKLKFQICISAFVLLCKRKLRADFHRKIIIFRPPGIFENENFAAHAPTRAAHRKFGFGLLKSCLTFG